MEMILTSPAALVALDVNRGTAPPSARASHVTKMLNQLEIIELDVIDGTRARVRRHPRIFER
jgi:hypothetical protein